MAHYFETTILLKCYYHNYFKENIEKNIESRLPELNTLDVPYYFSPIGQEYPFLQVSEIFLSRPAVSA